MPGAEMWALPNPTLPILRMAVQSRAGCDLHLHATQAVFGEGPRKARMFMIGEQPGNEEDIQGHPFAGPAGRMLGRALEDCPINRTVVYLKNVVKHFKFEERGKRRLHKKPQSTEIRACMPWLEAEVKLIKPRVIVCLGREEHELPALFCWTCGVRIVVTGWQAPTDVCPVNMREWLLKAKAIRDEKFPKSQWVFYDDQGERLYWFYAEWAEARKRAGVPNLLFHDLRRSAVRNMERAGVPRKIAMSISGHLTEAVYRRYDIVAERDLADAGTGMSEYFRAMSGGSGQNAEARRETTSTFLSTPEAAEGAPTEGDASPKP